MRGIGRIEFGILVQGGREIEALMFEEWFESFEGSHVTDTGVLGADPQDLCDFVIVEHVEVSEGEDLLIGFAHAFEGLSNAFGGFSFGGSEAGGGEVGCQLLGERHLRGG